MLPRETIAEFDQFLAARSLRLEAVVIGGAALALLGLTERQTRDVDVLHPILDPEVQAAAVEFAATARSAGFAELGDDWLNNGPSSLTRVLPEGWEDRLQPAYRGEAVVLTALGRADLLKTKLFALCDRGTDMLDCIALAPSREELDEALPWVEYQDANPLWPDHVRRTIEELSRRLGHAVP